MTLTIDNSECNLEGLNIDQLKKLRSILSYNLPAKPGSTPLRVPLIDKKGTFPTGLLPIVYRHFKGLGQTLTTKDLRKRPVSQPGLFKMNLGFTPYPEQIEAAEACLKRTRGIVVAPTGLGKSAIIALIINKLQVPTLVVVPTLELKRQLTETLSATFLSQKVGSIRDKKPIAVENVDALSSKSYANYDCVIIDEFHHSGAKTYRKLNKTAWKRTYYKFGMTATPFRSQDNEKLLLESVLSEVVYNINYVSCVSKGYIVPMECYFIDVPRTRVTGTTWKAVYNEIVVNNEERNKIIQLILDKLDKHDVSTLCLVKEIQHGINLATTFISGKDDWTPEMIKKFNKCQIKTLVATTGIMGEGVDTKPAEYVIIAGLGKSRPAFMQQCGRGFRNYPGKGSCKVILFRDPSHRWSLNHFKEQCKILKNEYGIIPARLDIDIFNE